MPEECKKYIEKANIKYIETDSLVDVGKDLDVLYVTRIQRERFGDLQEYEKVAGCYKITPETLNILGEETKIMHPLPRFDEIDPAVDKSKNAIYFEQAHNGIPVRQAILGLVMGVIN